MALASVNKPYFTFVKGLITEASPLTFPENASVDEDNFDLQRDGSRKRRLGFDYESGYALVGADQTLIESDNSAISIHTWENVNNDPSLTIGVVQVGSRLHFLNLSNTAPSASVLNVGSATAYYDLGVSSPKTIRIASVLGGAVLTMDGLKPKFITYIGESTDQITVSDIDMQIRDLFGVVDDLEVDANPGTLSDEHYYNLFNQGWSLSKINKYANLTYSTWVGTALRNLSVINIPSTPNGFRYRVTVAGTTGSVEPSWPTSVGATVVDGAVTWICDAAYTVGEYPSNSEIWHLGKDTSDDFDEDLLRKQYFGTSAAPKGHVIMDVFTRGLDRNAKLLADGGSVTSLATDEETGYPTTAASYAGRVFYSGIESRVNDKDKKSPIYNGFVFFTRLLRNEDDLGICYQEADPTSEHISDLLATDGGTINIPESGIILDLIPVGGSLIVVADNGCWEVFGGEIGFTATDLQVSKISDIVPVSRDSIVVADGAILLWAKSGIYVLSPSEVSGRMSAKNLTDQTIQTRYDAIPSVAKEHALGSFDSAGRKVSWLYTTDSSYTGSGEINKYNKELIFDTVLGAFYTRSIGTVPGTAPPYIAGSVETPNSTATTYQNLVTVNGDQVQVNGDDVVVGIQVSAVGATQLKYLTVKPNTTGDISFSLGLYNNTSFLDWYTDDSVGVDAAGYMIPGYELLGDAARNKQAKYITFHFNRTETGFQTVAGVLEAIGSSSCTVQPRWDFSDSANSGKFGTSFEAYRLKRNYIPTGVGDTFDYGQSVISTKNKVRGTGRAFSMRISTTAGKDCHLLGWEGSFVGQTDV